MFLCASFGSIELDVSAGMVAFITAMQPLFTAAISGRCVGEEPAPRQWFGILLGILAVGLVVADQTSVNGSGLA
ncbi:hypothetical protein AB833_03470 [Chromatiales bacterium (ex Bugula neritina AB1)]|nr:hypothetical protein AB833_03470 [Chromatiales bacterium (ex Bugula neritina AB1)]